jgi:sporulation protein YlmC with PRC-barrel domain
VRWPHFFLSFKPKEVDPMRNPSFVSTMVATLALTVCNQIVAQDAVRKPEATTTAAAAEQSGRVTRVRELLGLEVLNEAGETYGTIEDLMLNKMSGQIEFILVTPEKDSKDLYPLPWRTVTLYQGADQKDQYVILGMPREQFSKAPTIAREQLPTITYSQWNTYVPRVTTFYKPVRPAEARAIRRAERAIRRAVD